MLAVIRDHRIRGRRSGNDEARMVRAGLALNDEGMTEQEEGLMLMLIIESDVRGRNSELVMARAYLAD